MTLTESARAASIEAAVEHHGAGEPQASTAVTADATAMSLDGEE